MLFITHDGWSALLSRMRTSHSFKSAISNWHLQKHILLQQRKLALSSKMKSYCKLNAKPWIKEKPGEDFGLQSVYLSPLHALFLKHSAGMSVWSDAAPATRSFWVTSACPLCAAFIKGVTPWELAWFGLAPWDTRESNTCKWPLTAAKQSAGYPPWTTFGSAPSELRWLTYEHKYMILLSANMYISDSTQTELVWTKEHINNEQKRTLGRTCKRNAWWKRMLGQTRVNRGKIGVQGQSKVRNEPKTRMFIIIVEIITPAVLFTQKPP